MAFSSILVISTTARYVCLLFIDNEVKNRKIYSAKSANKLH